MRTFFSKATPEARIAMERRMTEDWKAKMAERREEDEAEQARRKWQKTEGDRKRKRNQQAREVAADIEAGRRDADGNLIKQVCSF